MSTSSVPISDIEEKLEYFSAHFIIHRIRRAGIANKVAEAIKIAVDTWENKVPQQGAAFDAWALALDDELHEIIFEIAIYSVQFEELLFLWHESIIKPFGSEDSRIQAVYRELEADAEECDNFETRIELAKEEHNARYDLWKSAV